MSFVELGKRTVHRSPLGPLHCSVRFTWTDLFSESEKLFVRHADVSNFTFRLASIGHNPWRENILKGFR